MSRMLFLGMTIFFAMVAIACLNGEQQAFAGVGCSGVSACCGTVDKGGDCCGRRARRHRRCSGQDECRGSKRSCRGVDDCSGRHRRRHRRDRCCGDSVVSCKGAVQKGAVQKGGAMQKGGPVQSGAAQKGAVQKGAVQKGGSVQKTVFRGGRARLFDNDLVFRRVTFR